MNFITFQAQMKGFIPFSLTDIRKIDARFDLRRLSEWQQKGYIKGIVKGYYIFSDLNLNEQALFEIANRIYAPSYVSLETALSFYGIIPEGVYSVTSVSSRRTYTFNTKAAVFNYRKVRPDLFFGYNLVRHEVRVYKFAGPEKAVLDYFYLNPQVNTREKIESLRYNSAAFFKQINRRRFKSYARRFSSRALSRRVGLLMEVMESD